MKKIFFVVVMVILFGLSISPSYAKSFNDNFNDGKVNKWWLGYSLANPSNNGNWRVESGILIQDTGYDGVIALIENAQFSNQTVETDIKLHGPSGGGGIAIWFKDNFNGVYISLANESLNVGEVNSNIWRTFTFPVSFNINENRWVNLKVDANSDNGDVNVYLDGVYAFTYHVATLNRSGQTGIISGNAGGAFDNFKIKAKAY